MRLRCASLLILFALVAASGTASAHAIAKETSPPAGERLTTAPTELLVIFTEDIDPAVTTLRLLNERGERIPLPDATIEPPRTARVPLPSLSQGGYLAQWGTLSKADGHATSGSWSFVVGEGSIIEAADATSANFRADAILGKLVAYAGLAILLASIAHEAYVMPNAAPPTARRLRALTLAAASLLVAGTLLFFESQLQASDLSLSTYIATSFGRDLVIRVLLSLAALGAALAWRTRAWAIWPLAGSALSYVVLASTHTHTVAYLAPAWLAAGIHFLHYASMLLWTGGLALLFLHLRHLPRDGSSAPGAHEAARRFGHLATVNVALVVLTGAIMYAALLGLDWRAGIENPYAGFLVAHAALGIVMIAAGGLNRWIHVSHLKGPDAADSFGAFRTSVMHEAAIGLAILLLAATITNLQPAPPGDANSDVPSEASPPGFFVLNGTTYATHLQVTPGPALNAASNYTAHVFRRDNGTSITEGRITLQFEHVGTGSKSDVVLLAPLGAGRFATEGAHLTLLGDYVVTITVQTPDVFFEKATFNLSLAR